MESSRKVVNFLGKLKNFCYHNPEIVSKSKEITMRMCKQTASDGKGSCKAANICKIPKTSAQHLIRKTIVVGVISKVSVHIVFLLVPLNLLLDPKS